jgi:putative salt-induced outer membrane protein
MMKSLLSATVASALLAAPAFAQDDPKGWTGEASLTGSQTTGNTDTTDVGLGLQLENEGTVWRHTFNAAADYGRADGQTNKQRFVLGYQIDRQLNDRLYGYANADYFNDDFGAFQDSWFVGGGLGYEVLTDEPLLWRVEAGAGYRNQTPQATLLIPNPDSTSEAALQLGSDFDWTINDKVTAYNDTELTYASSNTYIWNETGLTATLAGRLAARASFRIDYNTDVPLGRENTDTITRFGLVYTMD